MEHTIYCAWCGRPSATLCCSEPDCQAQQGDWQEQISQTTLWDDIERLKEDGLISW